MFGFGILDYVKFGAGVALGATLVFYPAKLIGVGEGKSQAALASLNKTVTLLKERSAVDAQISTIDATSLCADFGLSNDDEAECVRRLSAPDPKPEHVGDNTPNGPAIRQPSCGPQ